MGHIKSGKSSKIIYLGLFSFTSQKPAILTGVCRLLIAIVAAEMLSIFIKNSKIATLVVLSQPLIFSQIADDTTIFMKQLTKGLQTITNNSHLLQSFWSKNKFEQMLINAISSV